jgi:hypothetical protein
VLIEAWTVSAGRWETTVGVDAFDGLVSGWTASASRLLGPYREVAFTIPARRAGATYAFVAAMYTDSPVALWGDRALASGYRKRLARIDWPAPRRCSVVTLDGRPVASLSLEDGTARISRALLDERTALPLLGGLARGRTAISILDRSFQDPSVRVTAAQGRVSCDPGFIDGFPAVAQSVRPIRRQHAWGAFAFENVSARLTYPRHD